MPWTCFSCEEEFDDDASSYIVEDESYCQECFDDTGGSCERCGTLVLNEDLDRVVDVDEMWCQTCRERYASECDHCGDVVWETSEVHPSRYVCNYCLNEHYVCCSGCEEYYHGDYVRYHEGAGEYLCEECYDNEGRSAEIHDHSYRPSPNWKFTPKDKERDRLYFGVEVEMEAKAGHSPRDVASAIGDEDTEDIWYCKHDGSLSCQGVELVSHPFTFNWMKENPQAFGSLFNRRGQCLSYNTATCGMHVHMSVNAFSGLHLFKFATLFFHNPGFILLMSRRNPDKLNQWSACDLGGVPLTRIAAKKEKNNFRYCALNFLPRHTVECRIFRGTLSPPGFYANIEFLHGLYVFSKRGGINDITVPKFSIFMRDNMKTYPNFAATLGSRLPISMERRSEDVHCDLQASGETD